MSGGRRNGRPFASLRALAALLAGGCILTNGCHGEDLSKASAERIYLVRCARCHDADGGSRTASEKAQRRIDFRDPIFQQLNRDAQLREVVVHGKGKMMGVPGLSDAELDSILTYVRRLGLGMLGVAGPAPGSSQ